MEQNNKKKHLIITSEFPYGSGETFLETEIIYLAKVFDKVIIISHNVDSSFKRDCPSNVEVIRVPYTLNSFGKIKSLLVFLDYNFWREFKYIKKVYYKSISFGILKTMLISLSNAKRLKNVYSKIVNCYKAEFLLLYSYWGNDSAIALALMRLGSEKMKCISRVHRWDIYFEESKYNYLPYRSIIANGLNKIYSISQDGIEYASMIWKVDNTNFELSRLGIIKQTEFNECKNNNEFILVSCSNLIPVKRVSLIVKSLSQITELKVKWVHLGDGDLMNSIKEEARFSLLDNVAYEFKGSVSNKDVLQFYQSSKPDLFINLSSSEGVPVSIMEAMSFGIPVITTDVGGTSEIVNPENGYLIEKNPKPNVVSEKITEYFLLSKDDKDKKRQSAYKTWLEKFNANKNYTQFVEDILSL